MKWKLVPGQERNEALDCAVYTLALHRLMNPKWRKTAKKAAPKPVDNEAETKDSAPAKQATAEQSASSEQTAPKKKRRRRKPRMRTVFQVAVSYTHLTLPTKA